VDKAEGDTGIFIAALTLGVKGTDETERSAISRLRFRVPVFLPVTRGGNFPGPAEGVGQTGIGSSILG